MASISGVIPFGQSEVHVGYDLSKYTNTGVNTKLEQIKATFQYNLSKRTAMYTTASRLKNKDGTRYTLPGAAGLTARFGRLARYRVRSSPLLLIACLPSASSEQDRKAAFGRPFFALFLHAEPALSG